MRILAATYGQTPGTDEHRILYEPWGFSVDEVAVPIHAWHGDADHAASLELVRLVNHREMLEFLTGWRD